jgi:hypothetical protein
MTPDPVAFPVGITEVNHVLRRHTYILGSNKLLQRHNLRGNLSTWHTTIHVEDDHDFRPCKLLFHRWQELAPHTCACLNHHS